jgi:hypothetical protein
VFEPQDSHARVEHLKSYGVNPRGAAGGKNGQKEKGQVEQQEKGGKIEQSRFHAASPR